MVSATVAPRITARLQWTVLILLVISVGINYIDRGNLSVASVDLIHTLNLNPLQLGYLLSAFFWTYAGFMVLAGYFVEKYNVVWVYALGYFIWSGATALTGLANTFAVLFMLRLLLGMSESVAYPSYSKIIASSFPERQRGIANGLIDAGSKIGPALGMIVGGMILAKFGWRALFVSVGLVSLAWLIPWVLVAPKLDTHEAGKKLNAPSFLEILSKKDAWATFLCLFCGNYGWYFVLTWIPGYLQMERHYSKEQMALIGSLPFWAVACGAAFGGWAADRWITRGATPTLVRKAMTGGGLAICALFLLPSAIAANPVTAMILLMLACFAMGLFSGNHWAITQTLGGPSGAGKWTGLQNCAGNMAGVVAPTVTGFIVNKTGSFFFAFVWVCICLLVGSCSYIFFIGKIQTHCWKNDIPAREPI
jgi:MFS family permease